MALYPGDVYIVEDPQSGRHFHIVVSALRFNNEYVTVVVASSAGFEQQMEYDQTVVLDAEDDECFGAGTIVHPETITMIRAERLGRPRDRIARVPARMAEIIAAIGKVIGATCSEDPFFPPQEEMLGLGDS